MKPAIKFPNNRTRILIIPIIFSAVIFLALGAYAFYYLYRKPMNLVIVSIDTLRSDHLGRYGYEKPTSFYIDKWAKRGVTFRNVYSVVPVTYPSFIALMSGKNPLQSGGVVNNALESNPRMRAAVSPTLAEILRSRGYRTAAFVTNGFVGKYLSPLDLGFGEFYGMDETTTNNEEIYFDHINKAVDWIPKHKDKPFFLWLHLNDPHNPHKPSADLQCAFDTEYCPLAKQNTEITNEKRRAELEGCKKEPLPADDVEYFKMLYDGEVKSADLHFEEIIRSLRDNGLFNNTIVVVYGDHGEGFDHDYYFKHGDVLYDSAIRIPLMIINPRFMLAKDRMNDTLIQNTDIFNTVLDLLHIPARPLPDSVSFARQLQPLYGMPKSDAERDTVYSVNRDMTKFALVRNGYKYIYSTGDACLYNNQTEELYDLSKDPREQDNVISRPDKQNALASYRFSVRSYMTKLKDKALLNPPEASTKRQLQFRNRAV